MSSALWTRYIKLKTVRGEEVFGKRVILRVDFNVAFAKGKVEDEYKIDMTLPTIRLLLKNKCQIVLLSHLGRPEGRRVKAMSLKPVYNILRAKLPGVSMRFFDDEIDLCLTGKIKQSKGKILFLENIRFDRREDENSKSLARLLASMGDAYVNEAFATCHRANASTIGIVNYLPGFAGLHLEKEVHYLSRALNPKKPAMALIGGAKVSTKFKVIKNFLKIYDKVMLGGGLANTFFAAKGYDVGGSLMEKGTLKSAKSLLRSSRLMLPLDVIVTDRKTRRRARYVLVGKDKHLCAKNEEILDVGPATIRAYALEIRKAQTIVWGGPMGFVEIPRFSHGTLALAKLIGARASGRAVGIAGGGETLYAIHLSKMGKYYDFISTGGGAMLEFLEGKKLPGIEVLKHGVNKTI